MSKNLTRKGLALGAVVALGSSLFAGAPANAAGEIITLAQTAGTGNSTLLGYNYKLATTFSGVADGTTITYLVEGVPAANLANVTTRAVTADSSATAYAGSIVANDNADGNAYFTVASTAGHITDVKIALTGVTATKTVKVTAFMDNSVTDGKPGLNEPTSAPFTINFVKPSEVTATTVLEAPVLGATTAGLKAKVTLSNADINLAQFSDVVANIAEVNFKDAGGNTNVTSADENAIWSKTDAALVATKDVAGGVLKDVVYSAQAKLADATSGAVVGQSAVSTTAGTDAVSTPSVTRSADVSGTVVRTGTKTLSISSAATKSSVAVAAGVPALVEVYEATGTSVDSTTVITAGGKSFTGSTSASAQSISFTTTTNADGKVVFDLASSTGKVGDAVTVKVSVLGAAAYIPSSPVVFTWTDAAVAAVADVSVLGHNTPVRNLVKGGTSAFEWALRDSFGALVTDADKYRLAVTTGTNGSNLTLSTIVPIVGGKASYTVTDNSTTTGIDTITATLWKKSTAGVWETQVSTIAAATTTVHVVTAATVATVTATATSETVARTTADIIARDGRINTNVATAASSYFTNSTSVSGVVRDVNGAVIPGAAVTVSATGLGFRAGDVLAVGSITVNADANGAYEVFVASTTSGKKTITVNSGSATKTVDVTFAVAGELDGKTLTVTAPAYALPGRTVIITGLLVDKYGSPVDTNQAASDARTNTAMTFSVTYDGPGLVVGELPSKTDADGKFTFRVLLGAADTGSATVKASYDIDGATTTNAAITATATVVIGAAPVVAPTVVVAISGSTGKVYVSVTNAAGKKVVVKVSAKFAKSFTGTLAKKTQVVATTKGSKKITVYVGGKLVATKTVTVK